MGTSLELFLLDDATAGNVIALGRRGDDVAVETIPIDASVKRFLALKAAMDAAMLGKAARPTAAEVDQLGRDLFQWLFRGPLAAVYNRVPAGNVSVQILSNHPEIKALPWEFLLAPDRGPVPHRERCVVRVVETCGSDALAARRLRKIRVLFVVADPVDQAGVRWDDIKARMESVFQSQMPGGVQLKIVEGASRPALIKTIAAESFDIFHFLGHGDVQNGQGRLVLTDVKTRKSDFLLASQLATLLAGKGARLVLLSACLTAAGNYADDFSIVASALMKAGIPAVVANQVSIPNKTIAPFVEALYSTLLRTGNIDQAVMEGRVALFAGLSGATADAAVEWGIPTLYRLSNGAQLFTAP
jgi:hypothetical protein